MSAQSITVTCSPGGRARPRARFVPACAGSERLRRNALGTTRSTSLTGVARAASWRRTGTPHGRAACDQPPTRPFGRQWVALDSRAVPGRHRADPAPASGVPDPALAAPGAGSRVAGFRQRGSGRGQRDSGVRPCDIGPGLREGGVRPSGFRPLAARFRGASARFPGRAGRSPGPARISSGPAPIDFRPAPRDSLGRNAEASSVLDRLRRRSLDCGPRHTRTPARSRDCAAGSAVGGRPEIVDRSGNPVPGLNDEHGT